MEDFLSLSQDISLAMERYVEESPTDTVSGVYVTGEKFRFPNLLHDQFVVDEGKVVASKNAGI